MGSSERDIKKLCPAAKVEKGLAIQGGSVSGAQGTIEQWIFKRKKLRKESIL